MSQEQINIKRELSKNPEFDDEKMEEEVNNEQKD